MSKTMSELKMEFEEDIDDAEYLEKQGHHSIAESVKKAYSGNTHNTDGGKTSFYDIGGCKDVDDLCEHWGLSFAEGNCLKAIVGIAKARGGITRHKGTSAKRDANKLLHYAKRIVKVVEE